VRESFRAALLASGKPEEAERVFREWVKRAFDEAWKDSGARLTLEAL
jgi:hypothetical protein